MSPRLANARRARHLAVPEPVSGWELDPDAGWFSVVLPKEATNLITNPSVETATTGWAAAQGAETLARSADEQRRGAYALKITPTTVDNQGAYHAVSLTADTLYGAGVDLLGAPGVTYRVSILTTGGAAIATFPLVDVRGTGRWQRVTFKGSVSSTGTYRLYVRRRGTNSAPFYLDGAQVEAGLPSTYFDGDSVGFVRGQSAFYWTGTPHASTSVRSGQTRAGGTLMKLQDLGFTLLAMIGLGMAPVRNVALDYGYLDGAQYERTVTDPRAFTLVGTIQGDTMLDLQLKRKALIDAFKSDATGFQQPLVLQYQYGSGCGELSGETLNIVCNYVDALGGSLDNDYQERVPLQFTAYLPYFAADGSAAAVLDPLEQLSGGYLIRRVDGLWEAVHQGAGFNGGINALALDALRGRLYIGGGFTTVDGTTVNRVCYLDLTDNTFHALNAGGTVGVGGDVFALAVAANGDVYIGGQFTTAGGATADGLVLYEYGTDTFAPFTNGTPGDTIYALAFNSEGQLYGGGDFTDWDADADQDYIWLYDPEADAFSALGTGMNDVVRSIIPRDADTFYVGGDFTTGNGVTLNRIGLWSPLQSTFLPLFSSPVGVNNIVRAMALNPARGDLHIVGDFTDVNGNSDWDYYVVYTRGSRFVRGAADAMPNLGQSVHYVPGEGAYLGFESAVPLPKKPALLVLNIGATPLEIFSTQSGQIIDAWAGPGPDGILYTSSSLNAIAVDRPGLTTITNTGTAKTYPTLRLTGPGTLVSLINQTTGATISFGNYVMQTGEELVLVLEPGQVSFTSTANGNVLGRILPSSDLIRFFLTPGENVISLFIFGSTPARTLLEWRPQYWSLDGALP